MPKRRCLVPHPMHGGQVRCDRWADHRDPVPGVEDHFNSFFNRSWADEDLDYPSREELT